MERQFSNYEDLFEASHLFLAEFCDPYLNEVDSAIISMYRASKEIKKLRDEKHKTNSITSMVHEFENGINEQVISSLKKKNSDLLMRIRKINKHVGGGDN